MTRIELPARADRAAAEAIYPVLRDAVATGAVAVDGTGVAQIGQAMLQLLIAAQRSAKGVGHDFAITASGAMQAALAAAGADMLTVGEPA